MSRDSKIVHGYPVRSEKWTIYEQLDPVNPPQQLDQVNSTHDAIKKGRRTHSTARQKKDPRNHSDARQMKHRGRFMTREEVFYQMLAEEAEEEEEEALRQEAMRQEALRQEAMWKEASRQEQIDNAMKALIRQERKLAIQQKKQAIRQQIMRARLEIQEDDAVASITRKNKRNHPKEFHGMKRRLPNECRRSREKENEKRRRSREKKNEQNSRNRARYQKYASSGEPDDEAFWDAMDARDADDQAERERGFERMMQRKQIYDDRDDHYQDHSMVRPQAEVNGFTSPSYLAFNALRDDSPYESHCMRNTPPHETRSVAEARAAVEEARAKLNAATAALNQALQCTT